MEEAQTRVEFYRFLSLLRSQWLTPIEMKFLIWHYYNKIPYNKLAELDEKTWSRQYCERIVRRALDKLKIEFTKHTT